MPGQGNKQKDEKQTSLRTKKKRWNAAYRNVSMRLKALKNGINGRGDNKFGLPPSDIKDPLPNEVVSLLGQISSQFQQLVGEAEAIVDEQAGYSRTRRKKKPKQPKLTAPAPVVAPVPPAEEKVVEQLSRLGINSNELEKFATIDIEAQHAFKKVKKYWWQYIKSMFSKDEYNSYRMSMLSAANDLYYDLLDFENDVLSQPIKNMRQVLSRYQTVRDDVKVLQTSVEKLLTPPDGDKDGGPGEQSIRSTEPQERQTKPQTRPMPKMPPTPPTKDIDTIFNNIHMLFNANLAKDEVIGINKLIEQYRSTKNPVIKDVIIDTYNSVVSELAADVQHKYGPTNDTSVQGIINLIRKNSNTNPDIIKTAHNKLTRFLRKQIVKRLSFSKDAAHRLAISDQVATINEDVKDMIRGLEKTLDPETIENHLKEIDKGFDEIHQSFSVLMTLYRAVFYRLDKQKKQKGKEQLPPSEDTFLDELMRRRVRRDLSRDVF